MSYRHLIPRRATGERIDWTGVPSLAVDWFHPASGSHRPTTTVQLLADDDALAVRFAVEDRWVRSVVTGDGGMVCRDSCVEVFLQPPGCPGHVNIEVNAGGTVHASLVGDPRRDAAGDFLACRMFTAEQMATIARRGSLPPVVDPPDPEPCTWTLEMRVPVATLAAVTGVAVATTGTWRGNCFKCGDETPHPHWACWAPVGERLDFHQPEAFGTWTFAEAR